MSCRISCLILSLALLCAVASAESAPKAKLSYKLISLHVKGLNHFEEDRVVAASGLKLGQYAGEAEFKEAARKLGETGLFTELTYTYKYSTEGCELELQVAENDKLVPIIFDNLVWFSDDELLNLLRARLPLFPGRVPSGGDLTEQIAKALNSILSERRISGEIEYLPFAQENGPIEAYEYKVKMHPVLVRKMDFPGAAPEEIPALQGAAQQLSGQDYLRIHMRAQERSSFVPVYLARGYLKVQFAEAQAKVAEEGPPTLVDVSFPVTPGRQYKLTDVEFANTVVFPANKLREMVQMKPGQPANAVQLEDDLKEIHKLYATQGYLLSQIESVPTMDDSNSTVGYRIRVTEGDQYRMGELSIDGISAESAKKMAAQWQMKKGDPFDESYLQKFFGIMYRDVGLRVPYNVSSKQAMNREDKTVSVSLHFVPKS